MVQSHEYINFARSESSSGVLVHADDIFSEGYMKPMTHHDRRLKIQASTSAPATPFYRPEYSNIDKRSSSHGNFLKKLRKSSSEIFRKCSGILRPRKGIKVDDLGRKVWEVERWSNSLQTSPLNTPSIDVHVKYHAECPIYEAILHCKRSFEK